MSDEWGLMPVTVGTKPRSKSSKRWEKQFKNERLHAELTALRAQLAATEIRATEAEALEAEVTNRLRDAVAQLTALRARNEALEKVVEAAKGYRKHSGVVGYPGTDEYYRSRSVLDATLAELDRLRGGDGEGAG